MVNDAVQAGPAQHRFSLNDPQPPLEKASTPNFGPWGGRGGGTSKKNGEGYMDIDVWYF